MKKFLPIFIFLLLAVTAGGQEKALTKGEAIEQISAADFMREKIGQLLSWTVGYDISKVNRVRLVPTINYIKAVPRRVPPDGRTILEVTTSVDDPGGLSNISGVRADLSSIGNFPNMMLVDNGLWGDQVANDGIFTLQSSVNREVSAGDKEITVAAANKKGWLAVSRTTVEVKKDPVIVAAAARPERVLAGGELALEVEIENPGRPEDIREVLADLSELGLSRNTELFPLKPSLYGLKFSVPANISGGIKKILLQASNLAGGYTSAIMSVEVIR
jgi:hypothetical protein